MTAISSQPAMTAACTGGSNYIRLLSFSTGRADKTVGCAVPALTAGWCEDLCILTAAPLTVLCVC